MASLRKKGKVWYVRVRDESGRQREVKAGPDKSVVNQMKRDLESKTQRIKAGVLDPREADCLDAERIPITKHVADYVQNLEARGACPDHLKNVRKRLGWFLEETKISRLSQLRPSLAVTALKTLRDSGRSDQTVNHYAVCWKSFSRWAWKDRRTRTDLLADLEPPKIVTTSKRSVLSPEQAARLVASTRAGKVRCRMTGEDRAWLYTLAMVTGLRRGELQSLTPESFNLEGSPAVVSLPGRDTKNSDDAIQPLPSHVVPSLRSWLASKPVGLSLWPPERNNRSDGQDRPEGRRDRSGGVRLPLPETLVRLSDRPEWRVGQRQHGAGPSSRRGPDVRPLRSHTPRGPIPSRGPTSLPLGRFFPHPSHIRCLDGTERDHPGDHETLSRTVPSGPVKT